jgi:hypothetical protein
LRKGEIEREKAEKERDEWFNQARPMTTVKKTWREKRLVREECNDSEETDLSSGDDECQMDVNVVFELPAEFQSASD